MSANRIVTCFCWAPDVSGPAGIGFVRRLERGAAVGAEPGVRPFAAEHERHILSIFVPQLSQYWPCSALSPQRGRLRTSLLEADRQHHGKGCRSHAGKRGRPPGRSVATRRKLSGSRSAAVCQRTQSRAADDPHPGDSDRSGNRPDFPSWRIWTPCTALPGGRCARVEVRSNRASRQSAGSGWECSPPPHLNR